MRHKLLSQEEQAARREDGQEYIYLRRYFLLSPKDDDAINSGVVLCVVQLNRLLLAFNSAAVE